MKRLFPLFLILVLVLTACTQTAQTTPTPAPVSTPAVTTTPAPTPAPESTPEPAPEPATELPGPMDISFLSGAGGWSTDMVLNQDGTFHGYFHDSDMGSSGEGYDSTLYECEFDGSFTDIKKLDERTWSMTLAGYTTALEPGEQYDEGIPQPDGDIILRHIVTTPYGIDEGKDFILYGPDTPLEGLDEEFLSWWPGRWDGEGLTTLCCYGLYNVETGYGFFSYMTYPEGYISSYDEHAARTAAINYYENTVFEIETLPRIDVPSGWEGEIAFSVRCTKGGEAQPDRTITLSRVDGVWTVVGEGY